MYNSKTLVHSKSDIGGRKPNKERHSTIDKPETVSLVMPPMIIIRKTIKADTNNQDGIYFEEVNIIFTLLSIKTYILSDIKLKKINIFNNFFI